MNRRTRAVPRRSKGFTLIEMIIVLVIVGALVVLVGPRIASALSGTESTKHVSELSDLQNCVRQIYQSRADFATLTADTVANRCAPTNRRVVNAGVTNMLNPAGQQLTFAISANAPFNWVDVGSPGIPSEVCTKVLAQMAGSWTTMTATPAGGAAQVVQAAGAQLDEATLAAACGTNTTATLTLRMNKS